MALNSFEVYPANTLYRYKDNLLISYLYKESEVDAFFFQKIDEGFVEFRLDRAEAEPAPQGVIYDGQRAVGRVHAAYQINILRHKETMLQIKPLMILSARQSWFYLRIMPQS
jgi:hypothetical protein